MSQTWYISFIINQNTFFGKWKTSHFSHPKFILFFYRKFSFIIPFYVFQKYHPIKIREYLINSLYECNTHIQSTSLLTILITKFRLKLGKHCLPIIHLFSIHPDLNSPSFPSFLIRKEEGKYRREKKYESIKTYTSFHIFGNKLILTARIKV